MKKRFIGFVTLGVGLLLVALVPLIARSSAPVLKSMSTPPNADADLYVEGPEVGVQYDWRVYSASIAQLNLYFNSGVQNASSHFIHLADTNVLEQIVDGKTAGYFDGTSSVHIDKQQAPLYTPSTDMTFETWIKPDNIVQRSIIAGKREPSGTYNQWSMGVFDGTINYGFGKKIVCTYGIANGNFHDVATVEDVVDGSWHHVACRVRFGEGVDIFVDGELVPSVVIRNEGWSHFDIDADTTIGSAGNGSLFYKGYIEEARLYDRALSDTYISQLSSQIYAVLPSEFVSEYDVWDVHIDMGAGVETTNSITIETQTDIPNVSLRSSNLQMTTPEDSLVITAAHDTNQEVVVDWFNGSRSLAALHMPFLHRFDTVTSFNHDVDIINTPSLVEDNMRSVAYFDGNSAVTVADTDILQINEDVTLEAWIKPLNEQKKNH